jgi:peptide/nickel transport system substrate-binding protein
MLRRIGWLLAIFVVALVVGVPCLAQQAGGVFRWAVTNEPPNLDMTVTSASPVMQISNHIFETLLTFDDAWKPQLMLLDSYEKTPDGLRFVLHLRTGILFHNGKEMQAEDVVASLNRWLLAGQRGIPVAPLVDAVNALDKYTVELVFNKVYAPLENMLAYPIGGCIIIPKEIADAAGKNPLSDAQYIGTGPYRFVEWQPGRLIRLARFDGYKTRSEEPCGYSGRRTAYFDEIVFYPVADPLTRVAGVKAGDYDFAEQVPSDLIDTLQHDSTVRIYKMTPPESLYMMFNTRGGALTNELLRQALLAALDDDAIIMAAYGPVGEKDGAIAGYIPGMAWYTDAGLERYDQGDPAKARALAQAAGYKGETIRFMTTTERPAFYNAAVVIKDQWVRAGFNVDLQVYTWATVVQRRADDKLWEVFITSGGPKPDIAITDQMTPTYPGWWTTDARTNLAALINTETNSARRYALWEEYQTLWYYQAPSVMLGVSYLYAVASPRVKGLDDPPSHPLFYWAHMWNVWMENK